MSMIFVSSSSRYVVPSALSTWLISFLTISTRFFLDTWGQGGAGEGGARPAQGGAAGRGRGTHHSVQEVEGPQADGLVLVVQALQDEVLVGLHGLGVCSQDLGHGQQAQVLHCGDGEMQLTWTGPHRLLTGFGACTQRARPGLQPEPDDLGAGRTNRTRAPRDPKWLTGCREREVPVTSHVPTGATVCP